MQHVPQSTAKQSRWRWSRKWLIHSTAPFTSIFLVRPSSKSSKFERNIFAHGEQRRFALSSCPRSKKWEFERSISANREQWRCAPSCRSKSWEFERSISPYGEQRSFTSPCRVPSSIYILANPCIHLLAIPSSQYSNHKSNIS
jgi:hypothetical protein